MISTIVLSFDALSVWLLVQFARTYVPRLRREGLTDTGKVRHCIWKPRTAIYIGAGYGVVPLMVGLVFIVAGRSAVMRQGTFIWTVLFSLFPLIFLLVIEHLRTQSNLRWRDILGFETFSFPETILMAGKITLALFVPLQAVTWLTNVLYKHFDLAGNFLHLTDIKIGIGHSMASLIPFTLDSVLISPFTEELIFRTMIYASMKEKLGGVWALILTSVIFGIFHLDLHVFLNTSLLSVALIFAWESTGCLLCPIFVHMFYNLCMTVLILVTRSH